MTRDYIKVYERAETTEFLSNFTKFLDKETQRKVIQKIEEMICPDPYRYPMLKGPKFRGIRRMKMGAKGYKGGIRILYVIAEESEKNDYGYKCPACDKKGCKHIILLNVLPRRLAYE